MLSKRVHFAAFVFAAVRGALACGSSTASSDGSGGADAGALGDAALPDSAGAGGDGGPASTGPDGGAGVGGDAGLADGTVGAGDGSTARARVALNSKLSADSAGARTCTAIDGTDWVDVGQIGRTLDAGTVGVAIYDGDAWTGHIAEVTCRVAPVAGRFEVSASVTLDGVGQFTVQGPFSDLSPSEGITATFKRDDIGEYRQGNCSVTFASPTMGVAAGRVWGEISCNAVTDPYTHTCLAEAEFRFENCQQN
jgi:hypothetical protein